MRFPNILGALGIFIASVSAAPFALKNRTDANYPNGTASLPHVDYLKAGDATWVSDTKLCGDSTLQHSGYINVNNHTEVDKLNMAFWLFEATEHAEHLPLYIILGGEYGVPVTQSVFGPTGPCKPRLSYSGEDSFAQGRHDFNHWTNTLYIETPIGLGYSYADGDAVADLPEEEYLYNFLQRFTEAFPQFDQRRILIQSFDLGARVATSFARTILEHNAAIAQGEEFGKHLELDTMLLISPYLDPGVQMTYTRKLTRKNAAGKPWMGKDRSVGYKREYAIWKAECLGRDFKYGDARGKAATAYKSRDKDECMQRFRELWHGMMEGYDTDEYRWPDIDPFDVREVRQDRVSEFLYHRTTRPQLEEWLRDSSNQRRAGFASFADGGREYSAFDRAMVDDMLANTFFGEAPDGLDEAFNSGVKVVFVGGDMDVVTNWISLMKIAFQIDGVRQFMEAPWQPMDDRKIKDDIYPIPPRHLGDANLKQRVHMKDGGNVKYIMIRDAGHDIEKQEPALWNDLAMYLAWPQPPADLLEEALNYPPRYKPNKNVPDNEAAQWPDDLLYEQHEPHGLGHFHESNFPKEESGNDTFLDPLKLDKRGLTWELTREMALGRGLQRRSSPSDDAIAAEPGNGNLNLDMFEGVGDASQGADVAPFDPAAELRAIMRGYFDPMTKMRPDPRTLMDILDEFSDSDAPMDGYVYVSESDEFMDESDWEKSQGEKSDGEGSQGKKPGAEEYESWDMSETEYDYTYDHDTEQYQSDPHYMGLEDWLDEEYTLDPEGDEWTEMEEHVRQALSKAGYELEPQDGMGSYESEYLEDLINDANKPDPNWREMSPEQSQKIKNWVDKTNAETLEVPETGSTPDFLPDVDLSHPRLPGASLPNIPLQGAGNVAADAALHAAQAKARKYIASGQAGAAALGAGTAAAGTGAGALGTGASLAGTGAAGLGSAASLAGSTGSSASGAVSGLGGSAGTVAGGLAGGIGAGAGAGIGALFGGSDDDGGGGGGDSDRSENHHHHEQKADGGKKEGSSGNSKAEAKKESSKGDKKNSVDPNSKDATKPEQKTKPGASPAGGPAEGDKKKSVDAESKATTETEYSAESPAPPAAGEGAGDVEDDQDGDSNSDETDEQIRLEEKEAFDAKVKKIKEEAHKADDDAKDNYDAALERWKHAAECVYYADEGCDTIGDILDYQLQDDSWAAELEAREKTKDAKWSVNEVKKKIKAAAVAERKADSLAREASKAIDKVMKGDVGEAWEASHEHNIRHQIKLDMRDVLLRFEEPWFKAMADEELALTDLKEKEKIAEEKDAWDDALTKGHIPLDMAVATVEAAEREAEAKAKEKAEAEEQQKKSQ